MDERRDVSPQLKLIIKIPTQIHVSYHQHTLYTLAASSRIYLWTTPTTGSWSRWWLCREVRSMFGLTKDPSWPLVNNIPGESSVITKLRMHCADKYERGIFNWSWTWSRPCYFLPPPPVHDNSLICWIRHDKVDEITRRICDLGNESEEFHASRNVMGLFMNYEKYL